MSCKVLVDFTAHLLLYCDRLLFNVIFLPPQKQHYVALSGTLTLIIYIQNLEITPLPHVQPAISQGKCECRSYIT